MVGIRFVIGLASLLVASTAAVVNAGVGWVERVFVWAYSLVAGSFSMRPTWGPLATAGSSPPLYSAPPVHALRHEAGASRRAAARNT